MSQNNDKKESGYTLIETMIAISLFIIIVTIGMGTLLNANLLHHKSRDMRSILDNLSFTMDDMSRNLRTGYDYHCIDDGILPPPETEAHSCAVGGKGISFNSTIDPGYLTYYIGSKTDGESYGLFKKNNGTSAIQMTSSDIDIDPDSSEIIVSGAEPPSVGNSEQPFVTIKLKGTVNYKGDKTPFSLQTSVSQRLIDI